MSYYTDPHYVDPREISNKIVVENYWGHPLPCYYVACLLCNREVNVVEPGDCPHLPYPAVFKEKV